MTKFLKTLKTYFSYSLFATIYKPTPVTSHCATLIDLIWKNNFDNYLSSGIIFNSISDHFPVISSFSLSKPKFTAKPITFMIRKFSTDNISAFKSELTDYDWNNMQSNEVNYIFDNYVFHFLELFNKHFPKTTIKIKENHVGKSYITPAIIKSIKHRNKLQKLYAKWPMTYEAQFKSYRNKLTEVIRAAKHNYYLDKLNKEAGDSKKTWRTVNTLIGRKQSTLPSSLVHNGISVTDPQAVAESFNNYFSSIGNTLTMNSSDLQSSYKNYLPPPVPFSFFLMPTTLAELQSIICDIKGSSSGYDEINIRIIKECSDVISPFLVFIINKSFRDGWPPKYLQTSRIVPIFKKGDQSLIDKCRPLYFAKF